ncbi:MAG: T9SS type A sorting domain-containing protein [Bacteroides sp.]|nr:T9SS type A sorting domain-containing protein [Bacteroides sp.]MCM1085916.1 T9SS type A sorting domain-containing protein [Bacteroides sp.]
MKKMILLLGLAPLFVGSVVAQNDTIEDGKFAYWEQKTGTEGVKYDELSAPFWTSLNQLASLPADMFTGPVTMFKDPGRSGAVNDYAPRMVANQMLFGDSGMIFLPGVIGTIDVVFEKLTARTGRAFSSRPKAIRGYMKCAPVNGDSANIYVGLSRYNKTTGTRQVIGMVDKSYKETISEWTEFNLPIQYRSDDIPDTVIVLFVSSGGYDRNFKNLLHCQGQLGSMISVDDVEFVYDNVANETNEVLAGSKLYPNPSVSGVFNLNVGEACGMEVFSVSGQLIMQKNLATAGEYTVDLSRFAPGVYYIRLSNNDGMAALKAIKR